MNEQKLKDIHRFFSQLEEYKKDIDPSSLVERYANDLLKEVEYLKNIIQERDQHHYAILEQEGKRPPVFIVIWEKNNQFGVDEVFKTKLEARAYIQDKNDSFHYSIVEKELK